MKAILGLILFATVVSLDIPVYADDAAAGTNNTVSCPGTYESMTKKLDSGETVFDHCMKLQKELGNTSNTVTCTNAVAEMSKLLGKAKSACKSAGLTLKDKQDTSTTTSATTTTTDDCMQKAENCHDILANEPGSESDSSGVLNILSQAAGINLGDLGLGGQQKTYDPEDLKGQCYGRDDFDKQLKLAQDDLDKSKDKISDIQKDITEAKQSAEDDRNDANKELADLAKNSREEDLADAEAARGVETDMAKAEAEAKTQSASLNIEIIQTQGQLSNAILDRAQRLSDLTDAMINRRCGDMIVDSQNKLQKASGAFGSARSLIQNGARQSHNLNQDFNKCKKDMLNQREMTVQATQAQIDGLNAAIQAKIDQQNDISKGLNLAQTQKASRDQENAQSKQQKQQERTFTQQNMTQNLQTKTQNTQEKVANLQTQLNEANEKKNKASGRIALLGTEPAGEKSPQEAVETVGEYDGARRACYAACEPVGMENSCVNLDIDKEKVSNTKKADGTATTTSPSPSPTGGNTGGTMTEGNK